MRNTYLCRPVEKALSKYLAGILKESLDEIDPILRVTTVHTNDAISYDKEFSESAMYAKGHGKRPMYTHV